MEGRRCEGEAGSDDFANVADEATKRKEVEVE
jgi:hypothetical protein